MWGHDLHSVFWKSLSQTHLPDIKLRFLDLKKKIPCVDHIFLWTPCRIKLSKQCLLVNTKQALPFSTLSWADNNCETHHRTTIRGTGLFHFEFLFALAMGHNIHCFETLHVYHISKKYYSNYSLQWMVSHSWSPKKKIYLLDQRPGLISQEPLYSRVLLKWKGSEKDSDTDITGAWTMPPSLVLARELHTFKLLITIN